VVPDPVRGTGEVDDLGVVNDPVDHRCDCYWVTENVSPFTKRQIAGQDQ